MSESVKIKSELHPLKGQDHRSSINFTTEGFGNCNLEVLITDPASGEELDSVIFALKADRTGHDPVLDKEVENGDILSNPSHRNLYIADPKVYGKTKNKISSFEVTFTKIAK